MIGTGPDDAAAPWIRQGARYRLTADLPWEIGRPGSGLALVVPAGTAFDVSIPWALRRWLDPHNPRFLRAAALHDHALALGWDRVTAAALFHAALKSDQVRPALRCLMFLAVALYRWR